MHIKLHILRFLILVALRVAYAVKKQDRYRWLLHYVEGSGSDMWVASSHVQEILPALVREWADAVEYKLPTLVRYVSGINLWRIGFWSTLLYEGRGFTARPECFYLLGCFTYTVRWADDALEKEGVMVVEGADRYDWHSTQSDEGSEEWYTSPTPFWFALLMGVLFGREYFPTAGFPMGEPGISNRLWADLEKVGAKSFKSRFRLVVPVPEWDSHDRTEIVEEEEEDLF